MIELQAKPKRITPSFVWESVKKYEVNSIFEPFAGLALASNYFKRFGIKVITNDLLQCHFLPNKALCLNNSTEMLKEDIDTYMNKQPGVWEETYNDWTDVYFNSEQIKWLGWWRNCVENSLDDFKAGLGCISVYMTINYWLSLSYYKIKEVPLIPSQVIKRYLQVVNKWVYDNKKENEVYQDDALAIASKVSASMAYVYFPTSKGFLDSDTIIQLWEKWWQKDIKFDIIDHYKITNLEIGRPYEEDKESYLLAIFKWLYEAEHIKLWAIQHNEQLGVSLNDLKKMIVKFKKIEEERFIGINYPIEEKDNWKEYLIIAV